MLIITACWVLVALIWQPLRSHKPTRHRQTPNAKD
jgi:hypothetical protein